jgi:hypothetical protein
MSRTQSASGQSASAAVGRFPNSALDDPTEAARNTRESAWRGLVGRVTPLSSPWLLGYNGLDLTAPPEVPNARVF